MNLEPTYVKSELYTRASSDLNVEDDLLVDDPTTESAKASIEKNVIDKIDQKDTEC